MKNYTEGRYLTNNLKSKLSIRIERVWNMPNFKTFEIPEVRKLLNQEVGFDFIDPFPYPFKEDALEYLKQVASQSTNKLVFDPPYSQRQLKEMYDNIGSHVQIDNGYWAKCKDEIARIVKPGGKVVSFGWNSGGIGKNRGFEITRILLVNHGSMHNDTICTVEKKVQGVFC